MHRSPGFWLLLLLFGLWLGELAGTPEAPPSKPASARVPTSPPAGKVPGAHVEIGTLPASSRLATASHPGDPRPLPAPGSSGSLLWIGAEEQGGKSVLDTENLPCTIPADRHVEAVFVLDVSGSMGWIFEDTRTKALALLQALEDTRANGYEVRAALVGYRDKNDRDKLELHPMTQDWAALRAAFQGLHAHGGGLPGEYVQLGLDAALNKVAWRSDPDTTRLIYLFGDEPSNPYPMLPTIQEQAADAAGRGMVIHAINASQDRTSRHAEVERQWREISSATGGQYEEVQPKSARAACRARGQQAMQALGQALGQVLRGLSS